MLRQESFSTIVSQHVINDHDVKDFLEHGRDVEADQGWSQSCSWAWIEFDVCLSVCVRRVAACVRASLGGPRAAAGWLLFPSYPSEMEP